MIAFYVALSVTHVPSYGCSDNCCQLKHDYEVSQAFYLKDSGGVEIHLDKMNFTNKDYLDIDIVFRDKIDTSTFDLYIGCGGCDPEDPFLENTYESRSYSKPEIEPFTQTVYRSILPKNDRKVNFTKLNECKDRHFTMRLHKYENATTIFWSPVVGIKEQFTFLELLSFPIYIRRNHGIYWNEADYYFLWLLIVSPILVYTFGVSNLRKKKCIGLFKNRIETYKKIFMVSTYETSNVLKYTDTLFYDLSRIGFLSSLIDKLFSVIYVQSKIEYTNNFWASLLISTLPEFVMIGLTTLLYKNRRYDFIGFFSIFLGVFSFLLLGVGYFIGPTFLTIAGIYRFYFKPTNLLFLC